MYRSIVVPLDGTTFGEHALPTALDIARRCGAQLHLMHAHTVQEPGMGIRAREQDYLNEVVHRVNADGQCRGSGYSRRSGAGVAVLSS